MGLRRNKADYDDYEPSFSMNSSSNVYQFLLEKRIVMMDCELTPETANLWKAQLLYLNSIDSTKEISIYIDSPGGCVQTSLGLISLMQYISNPIRTVNIGSACSMGAVILSCGDTRCALPYTRVMIHDPRGMMGGDYTDFKIEMEEMSKIRVDLANILAKNCNKSVEEIYDNTVRDKWFTAEEAKEFGLIDQIIEKQ